MRFATEVQVSVATVWVAIVCVLSPAASIGESAPQRFAQLKELWRVGDDTSGDGPIFGLVSDLCLDREGNLYVADRQLSQVTVFGPDGQVKGHIGQEGDGPGEFRMPYRVHVTPGDEVWVLTSRFGFISRFSQAGEYLGDIRIPADPAGVVPAIRRIAGGDSTIVAHGMYRENTEFVVAGERIEDHRLIHIDNSGQVGPTYFAVGFPGDDARPVWSEKTQLLANRWDVSSSGRVYVASSFLDYKIDVFSASGERIQEISREYDHRRRSREEKKRIYDWATLNPNGNLPGTEFQIEDFDMDIMALYCRPDGRLWVLTSRGLHDRPPESAGIFDVYAANGSFLHSVALLGNADPEYDRFLFSGNRLYVARCFKSAVATMIAGGAENEFSNGCLEPMSVVCFEIVLEG